EIELDHQAVAVLVNQLFGVLFAAAMLAKQGVGHGVEHGGFAAAVGAGQHPQRVAVEGHFLLVAVREEALDQNPLRDHACGFSSSRSVSARRSNSSRSRLSANWRSR